MQRGGIYSVTVQKARKQKGVKRRSICVAEVKLWNNSDIGFKKFPNVFLRLTGAVSFTSIFRW